MAKKTLLYQQKDAPAYVGCALNTLKKHVKEGNLPAPIEEGGNKFWKKEDLDHFRRFLNKNRGKHGIAQTLAVNAAPKSEALQDDTPEQIGTLLDLSAGLALRSGYDPDMTLTQVEESARREIYELAHRNRIIEKLFQMAMSDAPTTSLSAIKEILSRIVPTLKTVHQTKGESADLAAKTERTTRALEIIALRMNDTKPSFTLSSAEYRTIDD